MNTDQEASAKEPPLQQLEEAIRDEEEQGSWSKTKKRLVCAGISVLGVILAFLLAAVFLQNCLIYPANQVKPGELRTPCYLGWNEKKIQSEDGNKNWERVEIKTGDNETLVCHWLEYVNHRNVPLKKEDLFTMIHFHGNGGNIENAASLHSHLMHHMKYRVLLVDYRGYGESSGSPSEAGLKLDAQAALDWTLKRLSEKERKKLVVYGQSMGGAVAIHLAADNPDKFKYLVVENTFLSLPKVAGEKSFLLYLLKPLIHQTWDNEKKIAKVKQHTLFLSSEQDQIVPPSHLRKLYELATSTASKKLVKILERGHNDAFLVLNYCSSMAAFLSEKMEKKQRTRRTLN